MDFLLNESEVRTLASLLEKEMATPEYYPLSLNSLVNACNQKSNRSPVVNYDESIVLQSLGTLKEMGLAYQSDATRVPKYAENFLTSSKLINQEAALLCVLMLRGPQTPGELRSRSERLHDFADLDAVHDTLRSLENLGYIQKLPRQPGCKEARFVHLLSGEKECAAEPAANDPGDLTTIPSPVARITQLENDLAALRREFDALKKELGVA